MENEKDYYSEPLLKTQPSTNSHDWKRDFYIWLPLMIVSWWLAWKYQDEYISDWDGFDYMAYAVRGWPSALGFGRALFLGYNHLLWKIAHHWFNLPLEHTYLVLQYGAIALSGPATLGIYALCKELSTSRLAAFFGALLVAASPFYIIYSGRAMSEIPAFLLLSWSLCWMLRCLRLGHVNRFLMAAFIVGLSVNIREFALFYFPFIPLAARIYGYSWKLGLKALALAVSGALAGVIFWTIYEPELYWTETLKWYALSVHERRLNPVTSDNFRFLGDFAYNCSCAVAIVAPLAFIWLWSRRRLRALFFFGCFGLLANLALLANHDLPVNPRYLLTGMLGLAAVCGWCLAELIKRYRVRAMPLLIGLVVLTKGTYNYMAKELYDQQWAARAAKNYVSRIEALPWHSAFIVGSRTPLINFYYRTGARPFWKTVSSGSGWPDDRLDEVIDDLLLAGRVIYVDFDPELWLPGVRKENRERAGLEMIKREYELEQVSGYFYRIVKRKNPPASHEE
ncbi:MAG: hypothetical protein L0226_12760 [Acidobacteria bacterium]|nr:hypothetical protein [Acidobacteriota bacterium]MCI0666049.1 hypothetical protein [Acidobacteriota bacterium]